MDDFLKLRELQLDARLNPLSDFVTRANEVYSRALRLYDEAAGAWSKRHAHAAKRDALVRFLTAAWLQLGRLQLSLMLSMPLHIRKKFVSITTVQRIRNVSIFSLRELWLLSKVLVSEFGSILW